MVNLAQFFLYYQLSKNPQLTQTVEAVKVEEGWPC